MLFSHGSLPVHHCRGLAVRARSVELKSAGWAGVLGGIIVPAGSYCADWNFCSFVPDVGTKADGAACLQPFGCT